MHVRRVIQAILSTTALPTLTWLAEMAVVSVLENIEEGELMIMTVSQTYTFGNPQSKQLESDRRAVVLHVKDDAFWLRLCLMGDLGFSEAFMYGEVACEDLISLFLIFLRNKSRLEQLNSRFSFLFSIPQKISSYRFLNTLSNSRSNISAHYDISNDMFAGFLSKDMTYSCAIFQDLDADARDACVKRLNGKVNLKRGVNGRHASLSNGIHKSHDDTSINGAEDINHRHREEQDQHYHINGINGAHRSNGIITNGGGVEKSQEYDELEDAQIRKIDHIIRLANILPGHRVLEIGSGWGSLSLRIATNPALHDVTVDTITLSSQQLALARQRMAEAGPDVAGRVRVHLMDYRAMPKEWKGQFDRVVSVEMIEAVGKEFMEEYWGVVDWAMKSEDGVGVVQCITIPESRYEKYSQEIDFIRKWVLFPGGILPSLSVLHQTLTDGSNGRLVVESVSNIGPHYARTLREWRKRFLENFDEVIAPALREEHPEIMHAGADQAEREVQVFKRKWIYYFCYCEVGFTTRTLGDHIITFTREGNKSYGCNVFN